MNRRAPILVGLLATALMSIHAPAQSPLSMDAQSSAITGTLTIHAIQGTPNGPKIADCDVRVDLMHRGMVMDSVRTRLDAEGTAVVEGLPVAAGFQPVASIAYAGVNYLQTGEVMDAQNLESQIEVICYEVTDQEPAWTIDVRHVMLVRDAEGIRITEIVQVTNPTSLTWLGTSRGYAKPATTSFTLPESASNLSLGRGFHDWCCTTLEDNALINHLPLMPGTTEMTLAYRIESMGKETPLAFEAPVEIGEVSIIVPEKIGAAGLNNIEGGGEARLGDTDVRLYGAMGVPAESTFGLTVATSWFAPPEEAQKTEQISAITKWIAGGGGILVLVAAGALIVLRRHGAVS